MNERLHGAIPPIHCLSAADGWDLLDFDDASCQDRHEPAAEAFEVAVSWLRQVAEDLGAGKLGRLAIKHPSADTPPLTFHDIDPSTAHLLIAGGRRGVNDVLDSERPALYIGVAAQATSTQWRGLAGIFMPVCSCPDEARGRAPALRFLRALDLSPLAVHELPYGLGPSDDWPTWLDERLVVAARLLPGANLWRTFRPGYLSDNGPILLTTGPRLSQQPNLMYLAAGRDLDVLVPHLPVRSTCRRGTASELMQLCSTSDTPAIEDRRLQITRRSRAAPAGWCIVLPAGERAEITRSCRLWLDAHTTVPSAEVVYAPRLPGGLVIDGSALISIWNAERAAQTARDQPLPH